MWRAMAAVRAGKTGGGARHTESKLNAGRRCVAPAACRDASIAPGAFANGVAFSVLRIQLYYHYQILMLSRGCSTASPHILEAIGKR